MGAFAFPEPQVSKEYSGLRPICGPEIPTP